MCQTNRGSEGSRVGGGAKCPLSPFAQRPENKTLTPPRDTSDAQLGFLRRWPKAMSVLAPVKEPGASAKFSPEPCFPGGYSPLCTLGSRQDGIWQRHLAAVGRKTPSSSTRVGVIDGLVGEEDVVFHTAEQEGGESGHEQELPGERGGGVGGCWVRAATSRQPPEW